MINYTQENVITEYWKNGGPNILGPKPVNGRKYDEHCREQELQDFEAFVTRELGVTSDRLTKADHPCHQLDTYTDPSVRVLWFMYNAGYHTRTSHILNFGCPVLTRLHGLRHPFEL